VLFTKGYWPYLAYRLPQACYASHVLGAATGSVYTVILNRVLLDQQAQLPTLAYWSAIILQFNNLIFIFIELKKVSAKRVVGYVMAFRVAWH
jgi:hypothetical protein